MPPSRSGAGGKIVSNRRKQRLSATPYERPLPLPSSHPREKSPNWFTGIVIPSARAIASGAGKILSSIFSESESSGSEDEDEGFASDNDVDNDNHSGNSYDGPNKLDEYGPESQSPMQRAETKKLIEQLIMQETFTREECDQLTEVLNSRVMGWSTEGKKSPLAGSPATKMAPHEDAELYNKAVEEAKKWFQEKKIVVSRTVFARGNSNLNSTGFEQVERGGDSPVDVARSYMNDRPPWASPTRNFESGTPLSTTMKLFGEGSSSVGRDALSSSKKRNSLASGSWNIQEELRRVRLKATEDMLRTPPSKIDPSLFAVGQSREESVGAVKLVLEVDERMMELDSSRNSKPANELFDAGVSYDPALAVLETRQDGKASEEPLSRPAISNHESNKDLEAVREDGEPTASELPPPLSTNHADEHPTEPQLIKTNGPPTTVVAVFVDQSTNGISSSQASLPPGPITDSGLYTGQNYHQHDMQLNDADASNENTSVNNNNHVDGKVLSDVPIATETNSIASGSQSHSIGAHSEELPSPSPKEKAQTAAGGKQQGRKPTQGNRRSLRKR